jgi:regulator of RNase E activity RraB
MVDFCPEFQAFEGSPNRNISKKYNTKKVSLFLRFFTNFVNNTITYLFDCATAKFQSMATPQGDSLTYRKQERIKLVNDLLEYNKDPNVLQQWGEFFIQQKHNDLAKIIYERIFVLFDLLETFRLEKKHRIAIISNEQANLRKQITETNNQKLKEHLNVQIEALAFENDLIARFPFTCYDYGQSEHDKFILEAFKGLINVTIVENPIYYQHAGKNVKSKDLIIKRDVAITNVLIPISIFSLFFL